MIKQKDKKIQYPKNTEISRNPFYIHLFSIFMKKYEFLHHTADAKFRAYGKTLDEAVSNAALATFEIMTKTKLIKPKITQHIELEAKSLRELLYDFIQELIILTDTDGFMLNKVKELKISGDEKRGGASQQR